MAQKPTISKMETVQTAVDWLFIQLYEKFEMKGDGIEMDKVLKQAKQMEEEQSKQDYDAGLFDGTMVDVKDRLYKNAEQYYTKTYGK